MEYTDINNQKTPDKSVVNKKINDFSGQTEPLLPWEQNEKEKEEAKQSFLSKYWMLLALIILLLAFPFTIFKINFGNFFQSSNSITSQNVISNTKPYLNAQEFASLFNTTDFGVGGFLYIYNNTFNKNIKIANNTFGSPLSDFYKYNSYGYLSNNLTSELTYLDSENITNSNGKVEGNMGVVGTTYETSKPIYIYTNMFSTSYSYTSSVVFDNKTFNGMEYSLSNASASSSETLSNGTSITYVTTTFNFLGIKNNNVYNLIFIITTYGSFKVPTLNITKLLSTVSNFN